MNLSNNQPSPDQQIQHFSKLTQQSSMKVFEWGNSKFRAIFAGAAFGMAIINLDGKIIESNLTLQQMLGYAENELFGVSLTDLILPEDINDGFEFLTDFAITDHHRIDKRCICKLNQVIWVRLTISLIRNIDNSPHFFIGICEDITIQKQAQEMSHSAELLQVILNNIPQLIFWKDRNSMYLGCNKVFADAMGLTSPEQIIGMYDYDLPSITFAEAEKYRAVDLQIMESDQAQLGIIESQPNSNGKEMWVERNKIPIHNSSGDVIGILGTLQDITLNKQAEISLKTSLSNLQEVQAKLKYDACHDSLTGLYNRFWLIEKLKQIMGKNSLYAVLFIDLDRFKVINDSLGHLVGDELLRQVAQRLQECLTKNNSTVTRLGGDEFILLLEDIDDLPIATNLATQIQSQLRLPFNLHNYEIYITASIGITFGIKTYQQPEDILRDADIAMYQAKSKGNGRYEVFNPEILAGLMERLSLENDLRRAIANQEFFLDYQPLISLSDQSVCGFEALVRWRHPAKGIISPNRFIPIAEETGLINPLGFWILREACQQAQFWLQAFYQQSPFSINVNLSPMQLKQPDLGCQVRQILAETGLPASCLKLEITESCILETDSSQLIILNQLKEMGIKLCIDDFGTGYSSLGRLHEFPIDTLKIDRSFVKRIDSGSTEIIEMILALAKGLNMNTVAEGIENLEQLHRLIQLGCHYGQGYLFAQPLDLHASTQFIRKFAKKSLT
ncbi:PAS domain S-box/diguanylate cyclase (GGDEF) domain-containing protein [Synechococcus sp. PCC 7502]|uniref:sensor domain-containing protein n=1 Tax=Synechococcus sp. PCC 7502 TaxID=1173263 RepID=UPI00029F95CC|nr:bifunctional diguanylate cyclase/phosphodiesterase [Synechococcus sp. PCC 7502]AFY72202.1 PAS domain S-box/diguanylate cyclase (GGDEF) domain-containing protein [Synechococcus sp. PCC 7502]